MQVSSLLHPEVLLKDSSFFDGLSKNLRLLAYESLVDALVDEDYMKLLFDLYKCYTYMCGR